MDGIFCSWELVGADTLVSTPRGDLAEHHVDELFVTYEKVINESGIAKRGWHYEIADWGELGKATWRARKAFIDKFKESHKKYPCKLYVIFGFSHFLHAVIRVSGQFFAAPIVTAKDYNDAVRVIEQAKQQQAPPGRLEPTGTGDPKTGTKLYTQAEIADYVDSLLKFIGALNWHSEGGETRPPDVPGVSDAHPFKVLIEALSLIKQDFNSILNEKDKAEDIIREQSKFNALRADIWRVASDKTLDADELIQQLLNKTGPTIGVSRACYNTFVGSDPEAGDLQCSIEWCADGAKPTLGEKVSNTLVKHFIGRDIFVLTPASALEVVPRPFRAIAKPMIAALARAQNLDYAAMLPFYVNNKLEGLFSFDVCKDSIFKPSITGETKSVIDEMIGIVSKHISQRRAEEALHEAYDEMETRVKERTRELSEANEQLEGAIQQARALAEHAERASGGEKRVSRQHEPRDTHTAQCDNGFFPDNSQRGKK